jgi:AcrR family transcriptional regulator
VRPFLDVLGDLSGTLLAKSAKASIQTLRQILKIMPKPDRRTERTRAALMHSFVELVLTEGYEALTVDAMAARANVGRSTFYMHYRSKEDILRQSILRPSSALAAIVGSDASHERLVPLLHHFFEQRRRNQAFFQGRVRAVWIRCLAELIAPRLAALSRRARSRPILPLPLAAQQIAEAQIALIVNWIGARPVTKPDAIAEALAACTHAAVAALLRAKQGTAMILPNRNNRDNQPAAATIVTRDATP